MEQFPNLVPDSIDYDLGFLNVSESQTLSSGPIRFRHSLKVNNHKIKLVYKNRREADIQRVRDHFIDAAGQHHSFTVPISIWGGADIVGNASLYRYADTPEEEHVDGVNHDMNVKLLVLEGIELNYVLQGEPATLGAEAEVSSFVLNGTAPFILDGDDATPSTTATYVFNSGGAQQ
tara:strand:- start:270 stop:797 length:528 start_codon:yes stop_codon:yes gene_type:complete